MNAENKKLKKARLQKEKGAHARKIRKYTVAVLIAIMGIMSFSFADSHAELNKINITIASSTAISPMLLLMRKPDPADDLGGGATLSDEQKALLSIFKTQVVETIKGVLETELPDEDRKAFKAALGKIEKAIGKEDLAKLEKTIGELGLKVKAIEEKPANDKGSIKNLRTQITEQLEKNKASWEAFKRHENLNFKLELDADLLNKAAATILESTNLGGSAYLPGFEIVPGVTPIARPQAFLEAYCNSYPTAKSVIHWVNKVNPEGNAAFTSEGGVKPLLDFNFDTETSTARKAPGKIKISTEMLDDVDFIMGEIEGELRYQVDKAVDDGLLSGDGNAPNLKGVLTYSGGYTLTSITVQDPNRFDCIIAAAAQIRSLEFNPTHVFLNPIDATNMGLTKDTVGQYLFPAWTTPQGVTVPGLTVVMSNKITVGTFLVGDMSKFVVRNYKAFAIEFGWVNDDFEKNLVTIIAERRLHCYMSDNNTGAFVDDTFSVVQTAITPAL